MIVGTGAGAYAYESGATLRTSIGVGASDAPTLVGTNISGTAASLTAGTAATLSATLPVNKGGTNRTSYTTGDMLYASASNVLTPIAKPGTPNGEVLTWPNSAAIPSWVASISGDITDVLGGTNITVASSGGPQPTVNLDAAISLTSVTATSITGSSVVTTPKLTAIGALSIQTASNNNVTIAPNGTGTVQITGGQYLNLSGTAGSGGYGLRGTDATLNASNTASDGWGQVYHAGMTNGEGAFFEGTCAVTANTVQNLHTGFGSVPSIATCYLECTDAGGDAGYSDGDHVIISSGQGDFDNNHTGVAISFNGAGSNDTTVTIGTGGIYLLNKSTKVEAALTESKWQFRLKAWK
tara:strand:- start:1564 stop:2622 length:1059 start_codon:yes stop_codon:yes gene_type:complete